MAAMREYSAFRLHIANLMTQRVVGEVKAIQINKATQIVVPLSLALAIAWVRRSRKRLRLRHQGNATVGGLIRGVRVSAYIWPALGLGSAADPVFGTVPVLMCDNTQITERKARLKYRRTGWACYLVGGGILLGIFLHPAIYPR